MGSYLMLKSITPDLILSSCALRAQETADALAKAIGFKGAIHYLKELYLTSPDTLKEMLSMQEDEHDTLFVIGHNPQLRDLVNQLLDTEQISKLPTMGIAAVNFDIARWSELDTAVGSLDFFIHPKQFTYYMPQQIRATLQH